MDQASVAATFVISLISAFTLSLQSSIGTTPYIPAVTPVKPRPPIRPPNTNPGRVATIQLLGSSTLTFLESYSWPLKSVVLPFGTTLTTFQGLVAENGPNGNSVNPFLDYAAVGGAYKYILNIQGGNNAVFQLRLPTSQVSVPPFRVWASVTRGSASFNTLTGLGNQSIIQIGQVGNLVNATSIALNANEANPSKQFSIVTSASASIEIWLDSIDSTQTPLKVSATVSPQQSTPILDVKEAQKSFASFTRGGPSSTNSTGAITLPVVTQDVPTRLECDSDVYSWCADQTRYLNNQDVMIRVDALVKPRFLRIDLVQPRELFNTMTSDGPFIEAPSLGSNVPQVFADDIVQLMSTMYFDQLNTQGIRRQVNSSTDTVGPIRLSAEEIRLLFLHENGQQSGLQSTFVRNDVDLTLSLLVEATDDSAIFWASPTSSQICTLSRNEQSPALGNLTNVEYLTDAKVINQENFLLQIKDVLETSMTVTPLGDGLANSQGETTGATIQGFPQAGTVQGTVQDNLSYNVQVFGRNETESSESTNVGEGIIATLTNSLTEISLMNPFGTAGTTTIPFDLTKEGPVYFWATRSSDTTLVDRESIFQFSFSTSPLQMGQSDVFASSVNDQGISCTYFKGAYQGVVNNIVSDTNAQYRSTVNPSQQAVWNFTDISTVGSNPFSIVANQGLSPPSLTGLSNVCWMESSADYLVIGGFPYFPGNPTLAQTSDGNNFELLSGVSFEVVWKIRYLDDKWLICGQFNNLAKFTWSTDLLDVAQFTANTQTSSTLSQFVDVAYNGTTWVLVGSSLNSANSDNPILYSTDLATFTPATIASGTFYKPGALLQDTIQSRWVVGAWNPTSQIAGTQTSILYTSTNAVTWTPIDSSLYLNDPTNTLDNFGQIPLIVNLGLQYQNNITATPFVYLTPYNNLVSLRIDFADGSSQQCSSNNGAPLLQVPQRTYHGRLGNATKPWQTLPCNAGIFSGALFDNVSIQSPGFSPSAGTINPNLQDNQGSVYYWYPQAGRGDSIGDVLWPGSLSGLVNSSQETTVTQDSNGNVIIAGPMTDTQLQNQTVSYQINQLLVENFAQFLGSAQTAPDAWPAQWYSFMTNQPKLNNGNLVDSTGAPAQPFCQYQIRNDPTQSNNLAQANQPSVWWNSYTVTTNAPAGCPQALNLPPGVVRVVLDYSDASPFANDVRFLASAKFFGLLSLPENQGAQLELGVGGIIPGDSPPMVPQSWIPTPSQALRRLALDGATSIAQDASGVQSLVVASVASGSTTGSLWQFSKTSDIATLQTSPTSQARVLQDILSTVNVQGFQWTYQIRQFAAQNVPTQDPVTLGLVDSPAILSGIGSSFVPLPSVSDQSILTLWDQTTLPYQFSNKSRFNVPNLVGYSDFQLSFQLQDQSWPVFMEALQDFQQQVPQEGSTGIYKAGFFLGMITNAIFAGEEPFNTSFENDPIAGNGNWPSPFWIQPGFISASDGYLAGNPALFWNAILQEYFFRQSPGVEIFSDDDSYTFRITVIFSKLTAPLSDFWFRGHDTDFRSVVQGYFNVEGQSNPAPTNILMVDADLVQFKNNTPSNKPLPQSVSEAIYKPNVATDSMIMSTRKPLQRRFRQQTNPETNIGFNQDHAPGSDVSATEFFFTGGAFNIAWVSSSALSQTSQRQVNSWISTVSPLDQANDIQNQGYTTIQPQSERGNFTATGPSSPTFNQQGLEFVQQSQNGLSSLTGPLLTTIRKTQPQTQLCASNEWASFWGWESTSADNNLQEVTVQGANTDNQLDTGNAMQAMNAFIHQSQMSTSPLHFPYNYGGPSTREPRHAIPLGGVESLINATGPQHFTDEAPQSQAMSIFQSPTPARLQRAVQVADAQAQEDLIEGLDNAVVGNLIVTNHNNIVPLEIQVSLKTLDVATQVFGRNNQDQLEVDAGQQAAGEFQNNQLDDISSPNPFGESNTTPMCVVDAGSFYFWATRSFGGGDSVLFQFSYKTDPLVMGLSDITRDFDGPDDFLGTTCAVFKNQQQGIGWDTSLPTYKNFMYKAFTAPTNISTTWNMFYSAPGNFSSVIQTGSAITNGIDLVEWMTASSDYLVLVGTASGSNDGYVYTTDGLTWTPLVGMNALGNYFTRVRFINGLWVVLGQVVNGVGSSGGFLSWSTDPTDVSQFTANYVDFSTGSKLTIALDIAWDGSRQVVTGNSWNPGVTSIFYSDDLVTWNAATLNGGFFQSAQTVSYNGRWLAGGYWSKDFTGFDSVSSLWTSTDGASWQPIETPMFATSGPNPEPIPILSNGGGVVYLIANLVTDENPQDTQNIDVTEDISGWLVEYNGQLRLLNANNAQTMMTDTLLKPAVTLKTGSVTLQGLAQSVENEINKALNRLFSGAQFKQVSVTIVNQRLQFAWANPQCLYPTRLVLNDQPGLWFPNKIEPTDVPSSLAQQVLDSITIQVNTGRTPWFSTDGPNPMSYRGLEECATLLGLPQNTLDTSFGVSSPVAYVPNDWTSNIGLYYQWFNYFTGTSLDTPSSSTWNDPFEDSAINVYTVDDQAFGPNRAIRGGLPVITERVPGTIQDTILTNPVPSGSQIRMTTGFAQIGGYLGNENAEASFAYNGAPFGLFGSPQDTQDAYNSLFQSSNRLASFSNESEAATAAQVWSPTTNNNFWPAQGPFPDFYLRATGPGVTIETGIPISFVSSVQNVPYQVFQDVSGVDSIAKMQSATGLELFQTGSVLTFSSSNVSTYSVQQPFNSFLIETITGPTVNDYQLTAATEAFADSYTGLSLTLESSIDTNNFYGQVDRSLLEYIITGTLQTGTFVTQIPDPYVPIQEPMNSEAQSFRTPPQVFVDQSLTGPTGTSGATPNNILQLQAYTSAATGADLLTQGPRNVQYTTQQNQFSLQPIGFDDPVIPPSVYSTLEDVSVVASSAMSNFASTPDVQAILYNDLTVENPMNAFVARDTQIQTERIRLDLQCDLDRAMHGLLGVSQAQDPYLGSSFGFLGGSSSLTTGTIFANNDQYAQSTTLQNSAAMLGFEMDSLEDTYFCVYKNVNDVLMISQTADLGSTTFDYQPLPLLDENLMMNQKIYTIGQLQTFINEKLQVIQDYIRVNIETSWPDETGLLTVSFTRTPGNAVYPGQLRMQLNFIPGTSSALVSAHVGLEYRVAQDSTFIQDISNVTFAAGSLIQAQIDASARMLGLPVLGSTSTNVEQMFMAPPSQSAFTSTAIQTVSPYRCQTQPQVNVSILEGTNDLIQLRIDENYLTGFMRGGSLARPEVQTVDSYATTIQDTIRSLTSTVEAVAIEPRNWYTQQDLMGATSTYIFGNVWTLYVQPYAEVDAQLSQNANATGATGAANEAEAQLVASAMTLGLDTCLPQMSVLNQELPLSITGTIAVTGLTGPYPMPLPVGCQDNNPIEKPQITNPYDFVPLHARLDKNNTVSAAMPLYLEVTILQSPSLYQAVVNSPVNAIQVSDGSSGLVSVPQMFMEDVVSALVGPTPEAVQGAGSVGEIQPWNLVQGLIQSSKDASSNAYASPAQARPSNLDLLQNPYTGFNFASRTDFINQLLSGNSSASQNYPAYLVDAATFQNTAVNPVQTMTFRFAGQAQDHSTKARPFASDLAGVVPQPQNLIPANVASNPINTVSWPVINGIPDARNLFMQNVLSNCNNDATVPQNTNGQRRRVQPSAYQNNAAQVFENMDNALPQVCIYTDVEVTAASQIANVGLPLQMNPYILVDYLPVTTLGGQVQTPTKITSPVIVQQVTTPLGSPNQTALGGSPFVLDTFVSQFGTHQLQVTIDIIETLQNEGLPPTDTIKVLQTQTSSTMICNATPTNTTPIRMTFRANTEQSTLSANSQVRLTVFAQLLTTANSTSQSTPQQKQVQNTYVVLQTNQNGTNAEAPLPCSSPPTTNLFSRLQTPLGPLIVGRSIEDVAFSNVVQPQPRLWKPEDRGLNPQASEQGVLVKAEGAMPSTALRDGLQTVQYRLITDVDISPGAASADPKNAGRIRDDPVLWFHGVTHESTLPIWNVRFGFSNTGNPAPLNFLGYNGPPSSAAFRTNLNSTSSHGIRFGVFPKSPALWLDGLLSMDETQTFGSSILSRVNEGLLSTSFDIIDAPDSAENYNLQTPTGPGLSTGPPFVPNGLSNALPNRLSWITNLVNVNGSNNKVLLFYGERNSKNLVFQKVLEFGVGQYTFNDVATELQRLINGFIASQQGLSFSVSITIVREGSATVLSCRMNNNSILDADGFAPFKIASRQEILGVRTTQNSTAIVKTHEEFGLVDGIQFQQQGQLAGPMNLLETQVPRILILEGVNDIVPLVQKPNDSDRLEDYYILPENASTKIAPGSQTQVQLATEIQGIIAKKIQQFDKFGNPFAQNGVIVIVVPRQVNRLDSHPKNEPSLNYVSNLEFLWIDNNVDSLSTFGTLGLSFDYVFLSELPNPKADQTRNRLSWSAMTYGFGTRGKTSTEWFGAPLLAPNPMLMPSNASAMVTFQSPGGMLTDNPDNVAGLNGLGIYFSTNAFGGTANPQTLTGWFPGTGPNVWGPNKTPFFDTLLTNNLASQYQLIEEQVPNAFELPQSAQEINLWTAEVAPFHLATAPTGFTADLFTANVVTELFLTAGIQTQDFYENIGPFDELLSLQIWAVGAGGGSAYGVGGAGAQLSAIADVTQITGPWTLIVGEGGNIPHGYPQSTTRQVIPDTEFGGGAGAVWPGSGGGGSSMILIGATGPTGPTGPAGTPILIVAGGGGAGSFDQTPGVWDGHLVSQGGSASGKGQGFSATDMSRNTSGQTVPNSGGSAASTQVASAGFFPNKLRETAATEFGNGRVLDENDVHRRTGGLSARGAGGGGGGLRGGGAGAAIEANPLKSSGGGAGLSTIDSLFSNVTTSAAFFKDNQQLIQLAYEPRGPFPTGRTNGFSGEFYANNQSLLDNNLIGPSWTQSKGSDGALILRQSQKLAPSLTLAGGTPVSGVYAQSNDRGESWNPAENLETNLSLETSQTSLAYGQNRWFIGGRADALNLKRAVYWSSDGFAWNACGDFFDDATNGVTSLLVCSSPKVLVATQSTSGWANYSTDFDTAATPTFSQVTTAIVGGIFSQTQDPQQSILFMMGQGITQSTDGSIYTAISIPAGQNSLNDIFGCAVSNQTFPTTNVYIAVGDQGTSPECFLISDASTQTTSWFTPPTNIGPSDIMPLCVIWSNLYQCFFMGGTPNGSTNKYFYKSPTNPSLATSPWTWTQINLPGLGSANSVTALCETTTTINVVTNDTANLFYISNDGNNFSAAINGSNATALFCCATNNPSF